MHKSTSNSRALLGFYLVYFQVLRNLCNVDIAEDMRVTGWRDECELTVYVSTLLCVCTHTSGADSLDRVHRTGKSFTCLPSSVYTYIQVRIVWTVWIVFTGQGKRFTCVHSSVYINRCVQYGLCPLQEDKNRS